MTRSSIAGQADGEGDGSLTDTVVQRLVDALDNDGDADPGRAVDRAQELAEAFPLQWTVLKQRAALAYIDALAEPKRTIFAQHLAGAKSRHIANTTGLTQKHVIKIIAKIYSEILHI